MSEPFEKPKKILSEAETRRRLIGNATYMGCEKELRIILDKTDRLLKNCTNLQEREHIAMFGAIEIHNLFGGYGTVDVNGKKVV